MGLKTLVALFGLAALGLAALPAEAAVTKCKAPDGSITYTQTSCPPGTQNADFAEDANPNRSATPNGYGSAAGRPGSPQAIMFKNAALSCVEHEDKTACATIDEAVAICEPKANWSSQTCVALREGLQAARDNYNGSDEESRREIRAICARGGAMACALNECPLDMFIKGSDEQIRACAARANLPVSGAWVKLDRGGNGAGSYVCLKKVERTTSIGERLTSRVTISVVSFSPVAGAPSQYTASPLPDERFTSANAAANAGCDAATTEASSEPASPRPGKKKGQQAV